MIKVVKNYANSLFTEAKKNSKENEVYKNIKLFGNVLKDFKVVNDMLCSPVIDFLQKNKLVEDLSNNLELDELVIRTLYVITKNSRINLFSEIVLEYEHLLMESNGIKAVSVVSATDMNAEEIEFIRNIVEAKLGTEIKLEHSVDESLLGGAVIKYESSLLDCSLKGALQRIHKGSETIINLNNRSLQK